MAVKEEWPFENQRAFEKAKELLQHTSDLGAMTGFFRFAALFVHMDDITALPLGGYWLSPDEIIDEMSCFNCNARRK